MVMSRDDILEDIRRQTRRPALSPTPLIEPAGGALPMGAPPPDGGVAPPGSPAPPLQAANRETPASVGSARGGAGTTTPIDMLTGADPEAVITSAETAARATSAIKDDDALAQKRQINEVMAAQGMDPMQAYEELKDQYLTGLDERHRAGEIDKKTYTKLKDRWKNIFNVVPKEDFGLFLMDFGLRLAAHSAENNFAGAFGQAGLGALQGVQQRQQARQEQALAREELAHKQAVDVARLGIERDRIAAIGRPTQVESTESGLIERTPSGEWRPIINPDTGKPYVRDYASSRPYQGEKAWLLDQYRAAFPDMTDAEIIEQITRQTVPVAERDRFWREHFNELAKEWTHRDETGKRYRDYTPEEREAWILRAMRAQDETIREYREGSRRGAGALGGGALGSGGERPAFNDDAARPPPGLSAEERAEWYRRRGSGGNQ